MSSFVIQKYHGYKFKNVLAGVDFNFKKLGLLNRPLFNRTVLNQKVFERYFWRE